MMGSMGWGMGLGWIIWLLLIALIVWAVKSVMDNQSRLSTIHRNENAALTILKERYARGEIDTEEYEEKRNLLAREIRK